MTLRPAPAFFALVLGWIAVTLADAQTIAEPSWVTAWKRAHPDPRVMSVAATARHETERARHRRNDLVDLALALGLGCAVLSLRPKESGDVAPRLLLWSGLALGAVSAGRALIEVSERASIDRWSVSDQALATVAGPNAERLLRWRERMAPDDAVIFVGGQDALLNTVAWALHPRPIYFVPMAVPDGMGLERVAELGAQLPQGRGAPARWLLDLDALAAGKPDRALLELPPTAQGDGTMPSDHDGDGVESQAAERVDAEAGAEQDR